MGRRSLDTFGIWFLGAGLASFGCSSDDLTQLIVVVDSDLSVPGELDTVRIVVTGPMSVEQTVSQRVGPGEAMLPLTLGLTPQGDQLGPVQVTATGFASATEVVAQTRSTTLVRGETRMLRLFLRRSCVGVSCDSGRTCETGACVDVAVPSDLLELWPGNPPPPIGETVDGGAPEDGGTDGGGVDAGAVDGGPDAGAVDGGGVDGGRDAGGVDAGRMDAGRMDAGRPDAGPPDAGVCDPILFDNATSANGSSRTITFMHATSGADRLLLVGVAHRGTSVSVMGVTYGAQIMTRVHREGTDPTIELFRLRNPALGASRVIVGFSAATPAAAGAVSLTGVNSTWLDAPFVANRGSGTVPRVDVTTITPGAWVLDVVSNDDRFGTPRAPQIRRWRDFNGEPYGYCSTAGPVATPGSVSMRWTLPVSETWRSIGVAIRPACTP